EYESVDNSDQIIRQIDKIDLNVTLSKISVEDFVKRQILYIIENRFFNEIAYEIDEITQKIQETSDLYENNGSKLGGDAEYAQLQWTISQLHSYYNRNFLYYEDHENFKKLITRAFDGLLKAYGLSPEYQHRLKEFQDYFLVIAVIH
ncbi:hypothetical protein, partial [Corallococcus praedator]|uniref:hypothetical protein n=1 Tax=Corallococcus praedator TaxID=2316724 RepID=UPI00131590B7